MKNELEFLRYFYEEAYDAFGPAVDDIYADIKERYVKETGNKLPQGYNDDE